MLCLWEERKRLQNSARRNPRIYTTKDPEKAVTVFKNGTIVSKKYFDQQKWLLGTRPTL